MIETRKRIQRERMNICMLKVDSTALIMKNMHFTMNDIPTPEIFLKSELLRKLQILNSVFIEKSTPCPM